MQQRRPIMLVVLDGWGWREEAADNAVRQARTPAFDRLWASCPHALLRTSGEDVGLPKGQMGNSEVGHLNIGAGRIVKQTLQRITDAIAAERRLKGWRRAKKDALIKGDWTLLSDLARNYTEHPRAGKRKA